MKTLNRSLVLLVLSLAAAGCSKEQPKNNVAAGKPAATAPGAGGPAANAPAAKPAPKPQGPLQSRSGTRTARFENTPSGRFVIVPLAKNRQDAEAIEATELECIVMSGTDTERIKVVAKPAEKDGAGKASRFSGYSSLLVKGGECVVSVTFPNEEPKMAQFAVPAGYKSY